MSYGFRNSETRGQGRYFDGWRWVRAPVTLWAPGSGWESTSVEWPQITQHIGKLYSYYHANGIAYQIGLATADHLLGPWTKDASNPLLTLGSSGAWDDAHIAHPTLIQKPNGDYVLVYFGDDGTNIQMGVATASDPAGPWTKSVSNPVITAPSGSNGGWGGPVFYYQDRFYVFYPEEQGSVGTFDAPTGWALYSASDPIGPWSKLGDVTVKGVGVNEALVHTIRSVTPIGSEFYAFGTVRQLFGSSRKQHIAAFASDDLLTWRAVPGTPLIFSLPDAVASEANYARLKPDDINYEHVFPVQDEAGLWLVASGRGNRNMGAWLGVPPGREFSMRIREYLNDASLATGATTSADDTRPLRLQDAHSVSVTCQATVNASATNGLKLGLYPSGDGMEFDTVAHSEKTLAVPASGTALQGTWNLDVRGFAFAQVRVENLDATYAATDVILDVTVKG